MAGLWLQPPLPVRLLARPLPPCSHSSPVADATRTSHICILCWAAPNCPCKVGGDAVVILLSSQRTCGAPTWRRVRSWRSTGYLPQTPLA